MSDILEKDLVSYDALSEVTRKERTALLSFSLLGLAIVAIPIIPVEITILGLKFEKFNQTVMLRLYALMLVYYWLTFLFYLLPDLSAWKRGEHIRYGAYLEARSEKETRGFAERAPEGPPSLSRSTTKFPVYFGLASYKFAIYASRARVLFDLAVPLFFPAYVILRLMRAT